MGPKTTARLLAVLAASILLAGCSTVPAIQGPSKMRALGDPALSGRASWPDAFDNAPASFDFDGDGRDEVIAHSDDTYVYVFDLDGRALAVLPTTYPPAWHIERILNGVEAGVLVPGDAPSIIVSNHAAYIAAWKFVPSASTRESFVFERSWEVRMSDCRGSPGMDAKPTLADVTRDGTLEILVQTEEIGFYALRPDGTILWKQCWAGGNSAPVASDLDGDGSIEVIVASDSGLVSVFAGATGAPLWTFNAAGAGIRPASIPASPTVAELDGRAPKEVLFVAREARNDDPATYGDNHMAIFAVHQSTVTWQSELLWVHQPLWANPLSNTRLMVRDVDADGSPDIFGMDWNTIGHYPGEWERLGPAHVFRLTATGQDVWVREVDAWWSNQDIALGDVNGDGTLDILASGPGDGGDGLWRLSAETGAAEAFISVAPWKTVRGPVLADLHNSGNMDLLLSVEPMDAAMGRGAILIMAFDVPYDG